MPTISIDFDGVLHSYTQGWTGPAPEDPPVPGAQQFIQRLLDRGHEVFIQSTRAGTPEGIEGMKSWWRRWDFPPLSEQLQITYEKPRAILYVDDRGFRFGGDFAPVLDMVDRDDAKAVCEPWNR